MAYRDYNKADGTKTTSCVWYPSDIKIARDNGLPDNWMLLVTDEEESNQRVEALAIRYKELGEQYPPEFKDFLIRKRRAYQDYKKGKENPKFKWYPSDIKIARDNGLPKNWMDYQMEILKSKNEQKSNDRLGELAIYYGRNGSGPWQYDSNKENKSLARWHNHKKSRNNPHEKSDDINWAELVALSKSPNWIDPVTREPFKYSPLPENWRNIESNAWQEHLQKNQIKSSKNLEKLAYYYGKNGSAPSARESDKKNKSLAGWHNHKKSRNNNPHEKSDDITWAKIVALSKNCRA